MVRGFGGTGTVVWIWAIRQLSRFNGKDGWRAGAMEKCQRIGQPPEAEGACGIQGGCRTHACPVCHGVTRDGFHRSSLLRNQWRPEPEGQRKSGVVKRTFWLLDCGIRLRRTSTTFDGMTTSSSSPSRSHTTRVGMRGNPPMWMKRQFMGRMAGTQPRLAVSIRLRSHPVGNVCASQDIVGDNQCRR